MPNKRPEVSRLRKHALLVTSLVELGIIVFSLQTEALTYFLAVDTPVKLGTSEFGSNDIILSTNAQYGLSSPLAPGIQLAALHLQPNGIWLFSPANPVTLGGVEYGPRDVVGFDGTGYFLFLHGDDFNIPIQARIDALMFTQSGRIIVSFDVPVQFGASAFSPSDLLSLSTAGPDLYWSAAAAGVPESANLVGASLDANGALIVSFDVPVNLGGTEFQPGQLIQHNGGFSFSSYFKDNSWPPEAHLADFALPSPSGGISNTLFVTKGDDNQIILSWTGSCESGDFDYEIYEGSTAAYYSHSSKLCSTGGASVTAFTAPAGNAYYLVVPRNSAAEGSYGTDSNGAQRPQGTPVCAPQIVSSCGS